MKIRTSPSVLVTIIFAGLLLCFLHRAIFPAYAIIFFSFFLASLLFAHSIKGAGWVLHNLAFIFLALAMAELYFEFQKVDDSAGMPQYVYDRNLGYAARSGVFRAVKTYGFGRGVVADVNYTIDEN